MKKLLLLFALAALAVVPAAAADGLYHAQHIAFSPVAAGETGAGFIENIHANGPNVYAHEQYALKGGLPLTTYDVGIHISLPADVNCTAPILEGTTATFTTNPAGNGSAYHVFTPTDVGALRGLTVHVYWTFGTADGLAYTTGCQTVQLD